MKKILAVLLVVVLTLSLCSCSILDTAKGIKDIIKGRIIEVKDKAAGIFSRIFYKDGEEVDFDGDIDDIEGLLGFSTDPYEGDGGSEPDLPYNLTVETENKAGDHTLDYCGAYMIEASESDLYEDTLRVYYLFTNGAQYDTSMYESIAFMAYQDGEELWKCVSYIDEDSTEELRYIHPGVTNRACIEFGFDPDGGDVDIYAFEMNGNGDNYIKTTVSPDGLSTEMPEKYERKLIEDPTWTDNLDWEGYVANWYINIDRAEYETDYEGNEAFRVYVYVTNNSDEEQFFCDLQYRTFQDGISNVQNWAAEPVEEDSNLYGPTQPGQTELKAFVCTFDSGSPVEVIISEYWSGDAVGGVFK